MSDSRWVADPPGSLAAWKHAECPHDSVVEYRTSVASSKRCNVCQMQVRLVKVYGKGEDSDGDNGTTN